MDIINSPIWLIIAKLFLTVVMIVSGFLAIVITLQARSWRKSLAILESELDETRDMAIMYATMQRAQMAEITERLKRRPTPENKDEWRTLLQHAGPVLSLLLKRETNLIKWGFTAFRLGRGLFSYYANKKANN